MTTEWPVYTLRISREALNLLLDRLNDGAVRGDRYVEQWGATDLGRGDIDLTATLHAGPYTPEKRHL